MEELYVVGAVASIIGTAFAIYKWWKTRTGQGAATVSPTPQNTCRIKCYGCGYEVEDSKDSENVKLAKAGILIRCEHCFRHTRHSVI